MKRLICLVCASLLLLAGCGKEAAVSYDPATLAPALLESGAFEQALGQLDADMIATYYGLETAPSEGVLYASLEGGYEELAVLQFDDEAAATKAVEAMNARVALQMETEKSVQYKPGDLPKLEGAVVRQEKEVAILVVANDYEKAEEALK